MEMLFIVFALWRISILPHDEIMLPIVSKFARASATPPYGLESDLFIGKMILCPACFSFWLGLFVVVMTGEPVYYAFAYSAFVIFLERITS